MLYSFKGINIRLGSKPVPTISNSLLEKFSTNLLNESSLRGLPQIILDLARGLIHSMMNPKSPRDLARSVQNIFGAHKIFLSPKESEEIAQGLQGMVIADTLDSAKSPSIKTISVIEENHPTQPESLHPKLQEILEGEAVLKPKNSPREEVGILQDWLREAGFNIDDNKGKYRGYYGSRTVKAVRRFQWSVGLEKTGEVDQETLTALVKHRALVSEFGKDHPAFKITSQGLFLYKIGLGDISGSFEANRGVKTISTGKNDKGGVSYGKHQLASKVGTMAAFLRSPEAKDFAPLFDGLKPGIAEFNKVYLKVANESPHAFAEAQKKFLDRTHYEPALKIATELGFAVKDRGVQEAIYSASIQHSHRGVQKFFKDSINSVKDFSKLSPQKQIEILYEKRGIYMAANVGSSIQVKVNLSRYSREVKDAILLSNQGAKLTEFSPAKEKTPETTTEKETPPKKEELKLSAGLQEILVGKKILSRKKSTKEDVGLIQDLLKKAGYSIDDKGGKYRGIFGPQTEAAVKSFQKLQGLNVDGIIGKNTLQALWARSDGKTIAPPEMSKKATYQPSGLISQSKNLSEILQGQLTLGNNPKVAEGIQIIQRYLVTLGYSIGGFNHKTAGIFGPNTQKALKAFQKKQGLEASGILNQATLIKLDRIFQEATVGRRFINTQPGGPEGPKIYFKNPAYHLPMDEKTAKMLETAVLNSGVESIEISETTINTPGVHVKTSNHLKGRAIDINKVNGISVLAWYGDMDNPENPIKFLQDAFEAQAGIIRENYGPAYRNKLNKSLDSPKLEKRHRNHIHVSSNA